MNILFVVSEAVPYIATGGLADVAGALPKALCAMGEDCRVVLPLYGTIAEELRESLQYVGRFNVPLAWRNQYCGLFTGEAEGVTYYFLDNEYYFKRPSLYGYYDDGERFAFFSRAVLEMLPHLDFYPHILHCNDWQSAMVPAFRTLFYGENPFYHQMRTVFTIHNIQFQGKMDPVVLEEVLGLSEAQRGVVEYDKDANFMKGAIVTADALTTVSPTYGGEILDPWFSYGLDGPLREHREQLRGILNGIDTESYNPAADPALYAPFSAKEPAGKAENKRRLMAELGLADPDTMLLGMVTRLTDQKGIDLVRHVAGDILEQGISMAVLGSGDSVYEGFFEELSQQYPGRMAFVKGFIPSLARKIYGGADVFLMPSKTEPCGLAQMVALRYGTLPIVRETGGLGDSVRDMDRGDGNGYTFQDYNAYHMLDSILRAHADYRGETWPHKVAAAMACDFGWERSAAEYQTLYRQLLGRSV